MGIWKYVKAAFANRWNLLIVGGSTAFALLSGRPDIALPLVAAGEVAYLGMLGTHPRFQQYVEAREASLVRQRESESSAKSLRQILQTLPGSALSRFERLRGRCSELRQIAGDLRRSTTTDESVPFDSLQVSGLDRLLWIYLRLLFTQHSLAKFLERTSVERIQGDIQEIEARLEQLPPNEQSPHIQKMRRTLEDNLQTCRDRLTNFDKAQSNHELVGLEIDRLENKIKSLAEMAVNRQEPDFISGQVDQVATSMVETEKAMNELQFATGLGPIDDSVPELLQSPPVQIVQ